jgi:hypothetical protein
MGGREEAGKTGFGLPLLGFRRLARTTRPIRRGKQRPKFETLPCTKLDRRLEAHFLDLRLLADQVLEMTYITTDVNTVFGIYDTAVLAEKGVDALAGNGFPCRVRRVRFGTRVLGSLQCFTFFCTFNLYLLTFNF